MHLAQIVRGYSKARCLLPFLSFFPIYDCCSTPSSQAAMLTWHLTLLDRIEEPTVVMRDGRIYRSYPMWDLLLFVSSGNTNYGSISPHVNAITVRDAPHVFRGRWRRPVTCVPLCAIRRLQASSTSAGIKATNLPLYLLTITLFFSPPIPNPLMIQSIHGTL